MGFIDELNEEQRKAALKVEGPLLILAGAGSGKTKTITYRIAHMIREQNISPYSILAVTFTNKAAKEMKERVIKLTGDEGEKILISTFHSFGVRMLRMYGEKVGYASNFNIYDGDDQKKIITKILSDLGLKGDMYSPAKIISRLSKLKEDGIFPVDYERHVMNAHEKNILEIYRKYQGILRENVALDFADILIYTSELLNNTEVLSKIQERFKYIMVDEYQDTNIVQYNIVNKIASKYKNICVVGDEDQSIYGFRGADIRNILNFEKDYRNALVVKLEKNYRSTSVILDSANAVIRHNKSSKGKNLWTDKEGGEQIKLYEAESGIEEADYVVKTMKAFVEKNKYSYKDMTILYRTNAQSRQFEESFRRYTVPYKIFGGIQYYHRKEIKDMLAYLLVVNNPSDNLSLMRIINVPARGIGDKTIEKLQELKDNLNIPMLQVLKNIEHYGEFSAKIKTALYNLYSIFDHSQRMAEEGGSISEITQFIMKRTQYVEKLADEKEPERIENVKELLNSIVEIENNEPGIGLAQYLEKVSLTAASDEVEENQDYVKLMTIHTSKGLEFPVVFVVGMEEELFPGSSANMNDDELEEERRLCYVAITRAREELYMTYAKSRVVYGISSFLREPSRFIGEIPKKNIQMESIHLEPYGYKNTSLRSLSDIKKEIANNKNRDFSKFKYCVGDYVTHMKFGEGRVKNIDKEQILVDFRAVGEKKFQTTMAENFLVKS